MGYPDETEAEKDPMSHSSGLNSESAEAEATNTLRPAQMWKRALKKLQSVDLDPWLDFQTHHIPAQTAVRHRYNVIKKKWVVDELQVKIERNLFDRGAMRECFRLKKLPQFGVHANDWHYASNYVAKRYINTVDKQVYFDDVRLQMEAKLWGEAFNRQNPPKKAFSHFTFERSGHRLLVVDIQGVGDLYTDPQIHTADGVGYSDGNLGPRGMAFFFHSHRCNPLCEWLGLTVFDLAPSELGTNTPLYPQPSVHTRTDEDGEEPSVANASSSPKDEDSKLKKIHVDGSPGEVVKPVANPVSHPRGPFARRRAVSFSQSHVRLPNHGIRFGPTITRSTENMNHLDSRLRRRNSESLSYSSDEHPSSSAGFILFNGSSLSNLLDPDGDETASIGPFTTLKLDTMAPVLLDPNFSESSDSARPSFSFTPPLVTSSGQTQFPRPVLALDPFPVHIPRRSRDRAASGDSGYSCRINLLSCSTTPGATSGVAAPTATGILALSDMANSLSVTPAVIPISPPGLTLPFDFSTAATLVHSGLAGGSVSSLVDYSTPASPIGAPAMFQHQFSMPTSSYSMLNTSWDELTNNWASVDHWNHGWPHASGVRVGPVVPRRRRNLSESSDLDFDEDYRVTGNLLHQLMHENHKPSCADHPTNLDQEIGHSILGQIHHELARLDEAGLFLPNCKGSWSHAGLGGLLLKNHYLDDSDDEAVYHGPENPTNFADLSPNGGGDDGSSVERFSGQSVDWAAVLFHESHAAQLCCLEAMIVMAHYYLGLYTQLMLDCPIKPNQSDLRSGVDYLGRAAEGGDRRCMILLSRFLDVSASLSDSTHAVSKTAGPDDFLLLPALTSASRDAVPLISSDPWVEAISWYKKAVDTAGATSPGDGAPDEGLDAEGRYDAAEDLLPVYRILARMAEMYSIGGFGLKQNLNMAG
ncbi:Elongation factor 2 kinase [Fasciola hepatica]|uniref:Elongation factor 2 kinase n=1 Tax=Fasciola hepatica TaxID=6192 RepID=A0A4E0R4I0_FASHE|nr:Elongation factor 2 kinase [Fasciola hepatica]